jgi:ribulose-5-phosphate 4-epimerase/fuculose-1-phosphate aldolase
MTQSDFHPDEWAARLELAACYRVFAMLGWTEMIYNHITVRVPESVSGPKDKQFLINPFGLHYSEVTASNLVRINTQGHKLDASNGTPNPHPVNPAGFTVHAAIHNGVADAHCVMHTHTTSGIAVACSPAGLSQHNFYGAQLLGRVAYHDFEGITVHAEEGPRLLANMGDKKGVILRSHGLLALGATLPAAFVMLWTLQRACDVQVANAAMGGPIEVPNEVAQRCARDTLQFNPQYGAGQDVFNAMVRLVDRLDSSYKS